MLLGLEFAGDVAGVGVVDRWALDTGPEVCEKRLDAADGGHIRMLMPERR